MKGCVDWACTPSTMFIKGTSSCLSPVLSDHRIIGGCDGLKPSDVVSREMPLLHVRSHGHVAVNPIQPVSGVRSAVTKKLRCSSTTYRLLDQQTCAGCCCISSMYIAALLHGVLAAVRVLCNLRVLAESWGLQSWAPCATRPCLCQLASTPLRHLQQRRLLPLMTYLRSNSRWLEPLLKT
jgi:hypothetical protein